MEILPEIEAKWQKAWEEARVFEANPHPRKRKFFVTFPYPYMNGPLHVGHAFTATRVDVYARFKRMQGYNVLFPWAWHWTGETIAGASERVKKKDEAFIRALKEVDQVPNAELEKFVNPEYMAFYYTRENRITAKNIGYSVDWRREFHTTSPTFNKFIEWQYLRLRKKGYVVKGTHPVVWCPNCESPTGDADRQIGEGVSPEEYVLIKFRFGEKYLPAATFRPETIYGVTNLWVNPDATYVTAEVDGENWVISETAAEKLKEQKRNVKIHSRIEGKHIAGKKCLNPINGDKLPILPGWFVNPENATGVVYSVPAHAPFDLVALDELKENVELLGQFSIDPSEIANVKPIHMIAVEGFGENPAREVVEQLGAKNQHDPKTEEATKLLYKKEFHSGILKEICGEYAGERVREVKERLVKDFKEKGIATSMYDIPQTVICRCLTPCYVKILKDQWFLKYSDSKWKKKAMEALDTMLVYPHTAKQWFVSVIEWLREWACARRTGLGTALPWNPSWIVETLSDSTVYMAFYTVNHQIVKAGLKPEQLTPEVFDYIFLGRGSRKAVAEKSRIDSHLLENARKELLYWYPVDFRNSAKELVPNHLTFFIFHHVALFPREHWPKTVGVNGMLMVEGNKMSKSKGNFVTLRGAVKRYGADATRCALLLGAEGLEDCDWRVENAVDLKKKLESFYRLAHRIIKNAKEEEDSTVDRWLASVIQYRVRKVTESMEELKTRTALENAFFEIWNDFRWYQRRKGNIKARILYNTLKTWIQLLTPFIPHICEEIWSMVGEEPFASLSSYPEYDVQQVDVVAEETENLIKTLLSDTQSIIKATKLTPKKIVFYVADSWKWKLYLKTLEKSLHSTVNISTLMKEVVADPQFQPIAKKAANYLSQIISGVNKMPEEKKRRLLDVRVIEEQKVLEENSYFFSREFEASIQVYSESDPSRYDPSQRAKLAKPHRPAIYMEN